MEDHELVAAWRLLCALEFAAKMVKDGVPETHRGRFLELAKAQPVDAVGGVRMANAAIVAAGRALAEVMLPGYGAERFDQQVAAYHAESHPPADAAGRREDPAHDHR